MDKKIKSNVDSLKYGLGLCLMDLTLSFKLWIHYMFNKIGVL